VYLGGLGGAGVGGGPIPAAGHVGFSYDVGWDTEGGWEW
jgi:hypothetical protein